MSVTIKWRPADDKGRAFEHGTSSELNHIIEVIGSKIGPGDVVVLHAMSVASRSVFYDEVAAIVEQVGEITIWGDY